MSCYLKTEAAYFLVYLEARTPAPETVVTYEAYSFRYCILSISINLHLTPEVN